MSEARDRCAGEDGKGEKFSIVRFKVLVSRDPAASY